MWELARTHVPYSVIDLHLMEPYGTCSQKQSDGGSSIGFENRHSHNLLWKGPYRLERSEKSGPLRFIEEGGHMELALRFPTGLSQQPDQDTPCNRPVND